MLGIRNPSWLGARARVRPWEPIRRKFNLAKQKQIRWESQHTHFSAIKQQNFKTLKEIWPASAAAQTEASNWGDEVEYLVFHVDHDAQELRPSPRNLQILRTLKSRYPDEAFDAEAFKYMLESQPRRPYGDSLKDLAQVENDMRERRRMITSCFSQDEQVLTLTNVALLGSSRMKMNNKALVTDKQRYQDMMEIIPERASDCDHNYGSKLQSEVASTDCQGPPISIDHPIDGWGGCGLQVTFSAANLQEACRLHDQLIPLGPLMLALSAATPIYKGRLVATDTRWEALCAAGDDRTSSEQADICSRAGCAPVYLEESLSVQKLNDRFPALSDVRERDLHDCGLPATLASYFTHALKRDPITSSTSMPDVDDISGSAQEARVKLLDTQLSTWWPHVRLKLPVLSKTDAGLPWRVEFRPTDSQPSDMENAALVVAMRILQQTIKHFDLDLRIPLSTVEENMSRASDRAAVTDQVFKFSVRPMSLADDSVPIFDDWASLDVIFNGGEDGAGRVWLGLLNLAKDFLAQRDISEMSESEQETILGALDMLAARASGRLETPAKWMRRFVKRNSDDGLQQEEISPQMYFNMILALSG